MINGKTANGSIINGQIQYETDGWRSLKLPIGVTGQVFFKDNNNGTAGISGVLSASISTSANSPTLVLSPPNGYKFTDTKWGSNSYGTSLTAFSGFGAQSAGVGVALFASLKDGKLYFYNPNTFGNIMTILFTESAGYKNSISANPLTIGTSYI